MIKYIGTARRKELGYSQSTLAKLCGVSTNTISSLERGQFNPSIELCYKLILQLQLDSIDQLFDKDSIMHLYWSMAF